MLLLFASIHNKLFTFVRRLFTYVYNVNCYDWERERAGDEANEYGVLWTMPLVLPLVFFFSNSFYSIAFFFCSGLSSLSLSLSLYWFRSSVFFSSLSVFVRLCFFFDLLFKGGEPGGLVYLEAKLVLLRWLASAFLSLFLFFLRLLSDLPSLGLFFFLSFCSPVFARPPFRLLCVSFTSCVLCVHFVSVPCSCFCSSSVYPRGPFCFLSLCFRSSFVPR